MKETFKKIVLCERMECVFGFKKIDDYCNLCKNLKEINVTGKIPPMIVRVDRELEFKCYQNPGLPLHEKCPFGRKDASEKCRGCARLQQKIIKAKNKEL